MLPLSNAIEVLRVNKLRKVPSVGTVQLTEVPVLKFLEYQKGVELYLTQTFLLFLIRNNREKILPSGTCRMPKFLKNYVVLGKNLGN